MLKRSLAIATLVVTITASLSGLTNVYAQSPSKPALGEKKQCQVLTTELGRSLEEVRASSMFDKAGRILTTTLPSSNGKAGINYKFEYDAQGLLSSINGSDGLVARFEYSSRGKLQRSSFLLGDNYEYVVDAQGKVTKKTRRIGIAASSLLLLDQSHAPTFVKAAMVDPCTAARAAEVVAAGGVVLCCGTGYCDCQDAQAVYNAAKTVRKAVCGDSFELAMVESAV